VIYFKSLGHVIGDKGFSAAELLKSVHHQRMDSLEKTGFERLFASGTESLLEMFIQLLSPKQELLQGVDLILSVSSIKSENPGIGLRIHNHFNLSAECEVLEVQDACTGFVRALDLAYLYLSSKRYKRVLILVGDQYSKLFDSSQTHLSVLFSDGVSAQLLTSEPTRNDINSHFIVLDNLKQFLRNDSAGAKHLSIGVEADGLFMKGGGVYQFVISSFPTLLADLSASGFFSENLRWYVHQGSRAVVETIESQVKAKNGSLFRASKYGNLVGSSIPAQFLELPLEEDTTYAFLAFGMGLQMQLGIYRSGKIT